MEIIFKVKKKEKVVKGMRRYPRRNRVKIKDIWNDRLLFD